MLSIGMTAHAKTLTVGNSGDGNLHTLAVKSDGTLWGWGLNLYGQLGLGSTKNQLEPKKITDNVVSVSTGSRHSIILKADGIVYTSGANDYGQLGDGTTTNKYEPVTLGKDLLNYSAKPIKLMDNVKSAAAGGKHSLVIKTDGTLWAFGDNYEGELGGADTADDDDWLMQP
jgi:alpha-tubulin suppressor-like RCC1 family protein